MKVLKLSSLVAGAVSLVTMAATAQAATEVKYAMWDTLQQPAYQQCATDFEKTNPDIKIKITQTGWDDYWTGISTGMIAGTAPDVFTDHLAKFPEFAKNNQLVDLATYINRDKIDSKQYHDGLYEIWGKDGKQYGLPKDWDTIAFMVNMDAAKKAGVTLEELQNMTWNPKDGGTFEQIVRKLTIDRSGKNALDPKFNPKAVMQYGFQVPPGAGNTGSMGQTEWSYLAFPLGFKYQDAPWSNKFYYDNPAIAQTWDYLASLSKKGISAPMQMIQGTKAEALFVARRAAMVPQGSWMINFFKNNAKFNTAWVPAPMVDGKRMSMINGLADSIWAGSKVKDQAWKWVKYLSSPECQKTVASYGVVFPAIKGLAEQSQAAQKKAGIDSSAFITMSEHTFLPPIANKNAETDAVMSNAWQTVMTGKGNATDVLKTANEKVNAINQ